MSDSLKAIIQKSKRICFFGGAGVSTESGIPDFRSGGGLYNETYGALSPEEMLSHTYFIHHPENFYRFYKDKMLYPDAKPNGAHYALVELEKRGVLNAVVTQNVDGLHQAAGSKKVAELHGSVHRNYCMKCGKTYGLAYILGSEGVPKCEACGGIVRPDVVLYQEPLDEAVITWAVDGIRHADTLIVGGTSLVVYPAAGLIQYFKGDNLVIINKSTTSQDGQATLCIYDSVAKTLAEAVGPDKSVTE